MTMMDLEMTAPMIPRDTIIHGVQVTSRPAAPEPHIHYNRISFVIVLGAMGAKIGRRITAQHWIGSGPRCYDGGYTWNTGAMGDMDVFTDCMALSPVSHFNSSDGTFLDLGFVAVVGFCLHFRYTPGSVCLVACSWLC